MIRGSWARHKVASSLYSFPADFPVFQVEFEIIFGHSGRMYKNWGRKFLIVKEILKQIKSVSFYSIVGTVEWNFQIDHA